MKIKIALESSDQSLSHHTNNFFIERWYLFGNSFRVIRIFEIFIGNGISSWEFLEAETHEFWPVNQKPFKMFLKYMRETYFDPSARFNYRLWNHFDQLMTYSNPDCTTNCCEGINSGLNKNCPPLRTTVKILSLQKLWNTKMIIWKSMRI